MRPDRNPIGPQLVYSRKRTSSVGIEPESLNIRQTGPQAVLFPQQKPGVIVFLEVSKISDTDLVKVLKDVQPSFVFDLRLAPRFDLGRLNRRAVFALFDQIHTNYVDASIPLVSGEKSDSALDQLRTRIANAGSDRPLLFLFSTSENSVASGDQVIAMLSSVRANEPKLELFTLPAQQA